MLRAAHRRRNCGACRAMTSRIRDLMGFSTVDAMTSRRSWAYLIEGGAAKA